MQAKLTQIADISLNEWMTRGGDARIVLERATGLNRYFSAPYPRDVLAFSSSTSNDLSPEAHAYLLETFADSVDRLETGEGYGTCLEELRREIRAAYCLEPDTDVFFAPSGTDLEYVGLLAFAGQAVGGIVNHLLGADEVGSGCIYSAAGQYFANETALGVQVSPGQAVAGLPPIEMGDSPVRCGDGEALDSAVLSASLERSIVDALERDCFPLVHIVHGSKTGLVLPNLDDVDRLVARFGKRVGFVVDACQARITNAAIAEYLERGIVVFVTGSKFMGGPPFSGFALLPRGIATAAAQVPAGITNIFRRAELPQCWPGREICEDSGNAGLALRIKASLFELARFQGLGIARVTRVVDGFTAATDRLAQKLGVKKVAATPARNADAPADHPIEMLTLVTLDLCHGQDGAHGQDLTFDDAMGLHRELVNMGIRLGQPVRCVRLGDGCWGGTLRIGLSMPQIVRLDALSDDEIEAWFAQAMECIVGALGPLLAARTI